MNKKTFTINGEKITKFNLEIGSYKTNKKITIYEHKNYYVLKSYETFISIYYKPLKLLINDIDNFKCSVTTRRHHYNFISYIVNKENTKKNLHYSEWEGEVIKHEIFLNRNEFNKIIRKFFDFVLIDPLIKDIFKEYNLEKSFINLFKNFNDFKLKYTDSINGFNIKSIKTSELKTRTKNKYLLEGNSSEYREENLKFNLTITTNKKGTKIINKPQFKLINKSGLSFNNYNTKELDYYTCYYCY